MPPHVLVDFVVLPPGQGSSVTDFWGWDALKEQLRCPDDVSGDIGGCSARRDYENIEDLIVYLVKKNK